MSKRLIDANELISAMYYYEHNEGGLTAYDAQDIINKAPTIEPKRGEWQYVYKGKWMFRRCSCCKWTQTYDDSKYMGYRYNFCPNCGAEMKGEQDE